MLVPVSVHEPPVVFKAWLCLWGSSSLHLEISELHVDLSHLPWFMIWHVSISVHRFADIWVYPIFRQALLQWKASNVLGMRGTCGSLARACGVVSGKVRPKVALYVLAVGCLWQSWTIDGMGSSGWQWWTQRSKFPVYLMKRPRKQALLQCRTEKT